MKKAICLILAVILLCACGGAVSWQEQYDLGMRYLNEQNYDEAVLAFTAAIKIDPNQEDLYLALADVYMLQQNYSEAINILEKGQETLSQTSDGFTDKLAQVYIQRAQYLIAQGETEENLAAAFADYEKAKELGYTAANLWLGMADVYIRQGDYDKALDILQQGLKAVGDNPEILAKIAELENWHITDSDGVVRTRVRHLYVSQFDGETGWFHIIRYDAQGREVQVYLTHEMAMGEIVNGMKVDILYDEQGRRVQTYDFYPSFGELIKVTNTYNEQGLLVQQERTMNENPVFDYRYLYEYDDQGREISREIQDSKGEWYWRSTCEWDGMTMIEQKVNAMGGGPWAVQSTYDENGRLLKVVEFDTVTEYQYDAMGNQIRQTTYVNGTISTDAFVE